MGEIKEGTQLTKQQEKFLKELRQQTGPMHEALEANKYSKAIGDGTITVAGLGFFMKKFYGFFQPLEEPIYHPGIVPVDDVMQRRKLHLLRSDLAYLRLDEENLYPGNVNSILPDYSTVAAKMGIMYVIEGSTLGGKVIGRMLKKSLGLEDGKGTSYYNSYGEELGPMWKSFVFSLTDYAIKSNNEAEIIKSASDTFSGFKTWLDS